MTRILCVYCPADDARDPPLALCASWCEPFSPLVGIAPWAEDSLLLDISGLGHLFGSEAALVEQVVAEFARRGRRVRAALGETVGAAWAAARYGSSDLNSLPVAALRLPDETLDLLRQLGIERVGQAAALPRAGLGSRFGPLLLKRLDQFFGRLPEPVEPYRPALQLTAQQALEHPTARHEVVAELLGRLIGRVTATLTEHGLGAMRLACRLDCQPAVAVPGPSPRFEPVEAQVGLFVPSTSAKHLRELMGLRLERLRLPGPVAAVAVSVPLAVPQASQQPELFDHARRPRAALAGLIERLSSRLGRNAVLGVRLLPEAQPELAWRGEPLTGQPRRRALPPGELPPRPLVLLPQPQPLTAAAAPDGAPRQLQLAGQPLAVVRSWGPERIETGWWRGAMVRRDYYRVETAAGARYWVFRPRRAAGWFLHGTFD
jgi:protein ImuB